MTFAVRKHRFGQDNHCFIIAEVGNNHDGKKAQALRLIQRAASSGAHAVKFQTFKGDDIALKNQPAPKGFKTAKKFNNFCEFAASLAMPFDWYPCLIRKTHHLNMAFIATPCSIEAAEFLAHAGVDALKIASMDVTNVPLLKNVGHLKKPVIISSGMAALSELDEALAALGYPRKRDIIVMHCLSNYPLKPDDANLLQIRTLQSRYGLPVGFSDHARQNYLAFAAVSLGAKAIEKHFTLDKKLSGPEHFFSLEPQSLKDLVAGISHIEAAVQDRPFFTERPDSKQRSVFRRSLHCACALKKGTLLEPRHIEIKRPEGGLAPKYYEAVIGKRLSQNLKKYQPITWGAFKE